MDEEGIFWSLSRAGWVDVGGGVIYEVDGGKMWVESRNGGKMELRGS